MGLKKLKKTNTGRSEAKKTQSGTEISMKLDLGQKPIKLQANA